MKTRVVMALMPLESPRTINAQMNPRISVGLQTMTLMPQLTATLTIAELRKYIASAATDHDRFTRAINVLLSGVGRL